MKSQPLVEYGRIPVQAWERLGAAAAERGHPMHLCTVATVGEDDRPDARILVLRGASEQLRRIWFHSDRRSHKIRQIRRAPAVCAVTYDPRDGVQLRLRGEACVREDDIVADQHWRQTELSARSAYGLAPPPGSLLPQLDPRFLSHRRQLERMGDVDGRENFAVIEMAVHAIEWLQVSTMGDRRATMSRETEWSVQPLVP